MARFVAMPSGSVFRKEKMALATPPKGDVITTADVVEMLQLAEAVGKSESVGALVGAGKGLLDKAGLFGTTQGALTKPPAATTDEAIGAATPEMPMAGMERAPRREAETLLDKAAAAKVGAPPVTPSEKLFGSAPIVSAPRREMETALPKAPETPQQTQPSVTPPMEQTPATGAASPLGRGIIPKLGVAAGGIEIPQKFPVETPEERAFRQEAMRNIEAGAGIQGRIPEGAPPPAVDATKAVQDAIAGKPVPPPAPTAPVKVVLKESPKEPPAPPAPKPPTVYDIKKAPDRVATEITMMVLEGAKQRQIEAYIEQYQQQGTTVQDYYSMIGILKAAKEALPEGSNDRQRIFMEEENLRRKVKALMEEKGLKYDPTKELKVKVSEATEQQKIDALKAAGLRPGTEEYRQYIAENQEEAEDYLAAGGSIGGSGVVRRARRTAPAPRTAPAAAPAQAAPAPAGQASPVGTPVGGDIPQIEKPAGREGVVVETSPATAAGGRQTILRGVTKMGAQAEEQVSRQEPATKAAQFETLASKVAAGVPAPVSPKTDATISRKLATDEELYAQAVKMLQAEESKPTLQVPDKVTYQQLLSLARRATTPADQSTVLAAFERATNKPPPKTLVEMYSGDNETRAIAMLEAAFPARAAADDPFTRQEKFSRILRNLADVRSKGAAAEKTQAEEALTAAKAREREGFVAAGGIQAKVAQALSQAQANLSRAATDEERARRTAELLELEKIGIGAVVEQRLADALYKTARSIRTGGKGAGKKGKGGLTDYQEIQVKIKSMEQAIDDQEKEVADIRGKLARQKSASRKAQSLRQALARALPADESRIRMELADAEAELDAVSDVTAADLAVAVQALTQLKGSYNEQINEVLKRKEQPGQASQPVPTTERKQESAGGRPSPAPPARAGAK